MSGVHIVLRYFPVLGRAQAIRHSLMDAGVDFEDVRVSLSDWPRHREDPTFSGRYRALPTLTWGTVTLSEALPIASFITRRLGQGEGLSEEEATHREAICSSSYIDVLLRFADLIRADVTYPGADTGKGLTAMMPRILQKIELLDRQIPEVAWIGGGRPVIADFFVSEAFEVLRYVLGPPSRPSAARAPSAPRCARTCRGRTTSVGGREGEASRAFHSASGRGPSHRALARHRSILARALRVGRSRAHCSSCSLSSERRGVRNETTPPVETGVVQGMR